MKHAIEAIYENGAFRPIQSDAVAIADGQLVRITIDDQCEPDALRPAARTAKSKGVVGFDDQCEPEALRLAASVYDGLSDSDIDEIERIALERDHFFDKRSAD